MCRSSWKSAVEIYMLSRLACLNNGFDNNNNNNYIVSKQNAIVNSAHELDVHFAQQENLAMNRIRIGVRTFSRWKIADLPFLRPWCVNASASNIFQSRLLNGNTHRKSELTTFIANMIFSKVTALLLFIFFLIDNTEAGKGKP